MRTFLAWFSIGVIALIAYTYGAKAGRARYRDIRATVNAVWNDPKFKKARKKALKQANRAAKSATRHVQKMGHRR